MGDYGIYKGANYGFDSEQSEPLIPAKYRINPGQFGLALDARTANQLKEVADKLNTGAKTLEVQGLTGETMESIPDQHLKEIARLKRLAGADITFHGPLIEPVGLDRQGNWDPSLRVQAERQIWSAVERGQQMMLLNPSEVEKGKKAKYENDNLVVTLHSNNGLINVSNRIKEGGKEKITGVAVIDEYSGKSTMIPIEEDYFEGKTGDKAPKVDEEIERINRKIWLSGLHNISLEARRGKGYIDEGLRIDSKPRRKIGEGTIDEMDEEIEDGLQKESQEKIQILKQTYDLYKKDRKEYENYLNNSESEVLKLGRPIIEQKIDFLANGERATRDSYDQMKEMYNRAREALERELKIEKDGEVKNKIKQALNQLEEYKKEVAPKIPGYLKDPLRLNEFAEDVTKGIRVLSTLPISPPQYRKVEDFAVDKASETFAGVAFKAYDKFGDNAPILSIENPPAGMSGLTRADELKKLVNATRDRLSEELQDKKKLSAEKAKEIADKLIGITWDVGHINMIKKFGYTDEDLKKETETVKDYLKHVHLSDNFGMDHTELPMGMGNVPMKEHLGAIGDEMKRLKAIVETGNWYQHFKVSPLPETFAAFGSPIYPMQMQPYWSNSQGQVGSYFAGYGMNPDVHHSVYGSGFSGLPAELGGSMPGRNRLSGTPLD